eukprot:4195-Eustigmatos_ZCMA.PRE.1
MPLRFLGACRISTPLCQIARKLESQGEHGEFVHTTGVQQELRNEFVFCEIEALDSWPNSRPTRPGDGKTRQRVTGTRAEETTCFASLTLLFR